MERNVESTDVKKLSRLSERKAYAGKVPQVGGIDTFE